MEENNVEMLDVNNSDLTQNTSNEKKKKFPIFTIILIILVLGLAGYIGYDKFIKKQEGTKIKESQKEEDVQNKPTEEDSNKSYSEELLKENLTQNNNPKFDVYESKEEEKIYEITPSTESSNWKYQYSYYCTTSSCEILSGIDRKYALLYDGELKIINMPEKKVINVSLAGFKDIEKDFFAPENEYEVIYDEEKVYGISYYLSDSWAVDENEFISGYYNLKDSNILYKNEYGSILGYGRYLIASSKESLSILSSEEQKKIKNIEMESSHCATIFNNDDYFVINAACMDSKDLYIYTKDLKTIVEDSNYSIFYNKKVYVYEAGKIKIYNKQGELIKEIEKDNFEGFVNDYAILLDNNIIYLYNTNNDKLIKVSELDKGYHLDTNEEAGTGYYDKDDVAGNHKPGYYIMATNWGIDENDPNNLDEDGELLNAYEYYYIPETGETGKIKTFVGGYAKPVLYLYPEKDNTKVTVKFSHPENLTTTYPKFKESWNVTANKNGDLYDKSGKYYYGLYWEENSNKKVDFSEGFYVTKENAIDFLEEKLSIIGLNDKERNEFIMYWLPILEKNEKNLVYFELTEERDELNKLIIDPKPDSLLRLAIHVKKVDKKINIKEEKLETFKRVGFIAVEWGGVIY